MSGSLATGRFGRQAGKRRPILPMRMPGKAAAAMRAGANLTTTGTTGGRTWEEFLLG